MSARKVKFVETDPNRGGLPVKRKQVSQACDACRRKKRRCSHADGVDDGEPAAEGAEKRDRPGSSRSSSFLSPNPVAVNGSAAFPPSGPQGGPTLSPRSSNGATAFPERAMSVMSSPSDTSKPQTRFVGDLNPEAMFQEAAIPNSAQNSAQKYDVGIWFSQGSTNGSTGQPSQFITSRPPLAMDRFLMPFVKENCLTAVPPEADFAKLKSVFYNKIHPIFPVVPMPYLVTDTDETTQTVLKQLISLAASTDPEASRFLRLKNRGEVILSAQDFSQTLSSAIRAILETSLIPDRVMHIRALTILSMYSQPTCAEEADLPAQLGGRAIHHIQTLGLHLLRYDAPNCDELESLFCAVWALDRLNAAQYGRPCLIHERDIGTNLQSCIRKQPPCFRLLLSVIQWLDQVVELYRPGPTAEASGMEKVAFIDLPVLEAMIVDANALKVPSFLIGVYSSNDS